MVKNKMGIDEKILIRKNWFEKFQLENGWEKFGVVNDKILNWKIGEKYMNNLRKNYFAKNQCEIF